jgi:hypothetical protein
VTDQNEHPEKTPVETAVEHAVEALVYAPIGLLFEGASVLPQLVEKGRNQVTMARMLGQFAVKQGRQEATKVAGKLQDQAAGVLEFIGGSVAPIHESAPDEAPRSPRPAAPLRPLKKTPGAAREAARHVAGTPAAVAERKVAPSNEAPAKKTSSRKPASTASAASSNGAGSVSGLAIPDYDGLSASHVVNRLDGLSADELEAVRRYEAAHRGRKTILSKVAQLQSA